MFRPVYESRRKTRDVCTALTRRTFEVNTSRRHFGGNICRVAATLYFVSSGFSNNSVIGFWCSLQKSNNITWLIWSILLWKYSYSTWATSNKVAHLIVGSLVHRFQFDFIYNCINIVYFIKIIAAALSFFQNGSANKISGSPGPPAQFSHLKMNLLITDLEFNKKLVCFLYIELQNRLVWDFSFFVAA